MTRSPERSPPVRAVALAVFHDVAAVGPGHDHAAVPGRRPLVRERRDSPVDNIRPVVPRWSREDAALLWLRGTYRSYTDRDLQVVGEIIDATR